MLLLSGAAVALGQSAVATAGVNVRSGQSKSSRIVDHLDEGDTVQLLSTTKRLGYYHIMLSDSTKGWVYGRYLQLVDSTGVATRQPPRVTPTGVSTSTTNGGAAATSISPDWDKPALQSTTFHRAGFPDCGPVGAGGDTLTDRRKDRVDVPDSVHPVTFDAIMALPYPKNHKPSRLGWPASDLAVIAPYEGEAVSVTGFVAKQRGIIVENAQASKNGEATNCHATDDAGVDWHMTLVKHPNDPKSAGIVVETTPRVRANGHPWTPDMLANAIANGDSVRITGWLLYDPEHFAQTTNYDPARPSSGPTVRATLWEVHPVTKIEIFDSGTGQWRSIP
jgi:uncharacterized protein YraI